MGHRPFDRYQLYQESVQSPDTDVRFFKRVYQKHTGRDPVSLREDFCGTHAICCEWVKLSKDHVAYGLDLDPEPLIWGYAHNQSELTAEQKKRVNISRTNVLLPEVKSTDIVAALNFSYFIFKHRQDLLKYFKNVKAKMKPKGIFILDIFGGTQCQGPILDKRKLEGFEYQWEQKGFNPLSGYADFAIHFKVKNRVYKNVFTYNWRIWTIPEIKDLLTEAGFSHQYTYWEGTDKDGSGNGIFRQTSKAESCESWIAYVVAQA